MKYEIPDIKTDPHTLAEIKNATRSLKNGKAAEEDLILAELLKADRLHSREGEAQEVWRQEKIQIQEKTSRRLGT